MPAIYELRLLAIAETNGACVRYDNHAPRRIPPEVIASFELVTPDQESKIA